jgi:monofunctional biosynthetic peptidoglycan transglycosylase
MVESEPLSQEPVNPEKIPSRWSLWKFARRRWLLVLTSLFGVWILVEVLMLPFGDIARLKSENPGETAFMREHAAQAREAGKKFRVVQRWVPLSKIPEDVVNAIIVAEDGTFWTHGGFDWFEFRESMERNLTEGRAARGASTITQQLVKNLYLSPSKNPLRKLREWILTWWMEQNLKKRRILEIYLNVIEWGRGIYGINAAAQAYFGKPVQELTRDEGIRLAAVIPNPTRHGANEDSNYLERRTAIILNRMAVRGMLKNDLPGIARDSVDGMAQDTLHEMAKDSVNGLQRY